jgi:hypothetical protein
MRMKGIATKYLVLIVVAAVAAATIIAVSNQLIEGAFIDALDSSFTLSNG